MQRLHRSKEAKRWGPHKATKAAEAIVRVRPRNPMHYLTQWDTDTRFVVSLRRKEPHKASGGRAALPTEN